MTHEPDELRLARLTDWCRDGRLAAAELELAQWLHEASCPVAARVMLAGCLARRGEDQQALALLEPVVAHAAEPDAHAIRLLLALLTRLDYRHAAEALVQRLAAEGHIDAPLHRWLATMELAPAFDDADQPAAEELARELEPQLHLLDTLVAGQRLEPDPRTIALLRAAIIRLADQARDKAATVKLCEAAAELAHLADDPDDVRRWAYHGLGLEPACARLALLLAPLPDDAEYSPSVVQMLRQAVEFNPRYPDVRAAYIRRLLADGRADAARQQLRKWLWQRPDHPLALSLKEELAA